jgi:hypothetical protein
MMRPLPSYPVAADDRHAARAVRRAAMVAPLRGAFVEERGLPADINALLAALDALPD